MDFAPPSSVDDGLVTAGDRGKVDLEGSLIGPDVPNELGKVPPRAIELGWRSPEHHGVEVVLNSRCADHDVSHANRVCQCPRHTCADHQVDLGQMGQQVPSGHRELDLAQSSLGEDDVGGLVLVHVGPAHLTLFRTPPALFEHPRQDLEFLGYRCDDKSGHGALLS